VPTAQPALALAQKVIDRVTAAGVPDDLIPAELTSVSVRVGGDAENNLRTRILEFMAAVRAAEIAATAARGGGGELETNAVAANISAAEWREHWMECDADGIPRAVVHWSAEPQ
jgi:XTP/dITP diphosphohydrolase